MAVSDRPWSSFTAADYTPEQWRRACLIDTGEGDVDSKSRYKLPVREPGGAINRNGVHAAAAVLAGGRGGVQASAEQKAKAARALVRIYRTDLNEEPPDSLLRLAGQSSGRGNTMTSPTERRFTAVPVELRAKDQLRIGGYAATFNRLSQNLGGFREEVAPGFFNDSRSRGWLDVIARYNHDDNMLLGTIGGNTLRLSIDETGLFYEVDLPRSRADIAELVERGDVRKSSFAFRTLEDSWATTDGGFPLRTLVSGQLVDVAPVNTPAYNDTSVGKRAIDTIAALTSLAEHAHADLEEVRKLAEQDELRKFFVRADKSIKPENPKLFGPAAAAQLLARKADPWA